MVTKQEIERYTLKEIDNSFNSQITEWTQQVVAYIEKYTGREYSQTTETRLFDGNGKTEMLVGDYTNLTAVSIDGVDVEVMEYPANKDQKYKLQSNTGFRRGRQNVAVSATWGVAEIPADIKFACLVIVSGIVQNQVHSLKASESIGNYSVSFSTDGQRDDYNRAMKSLQMHQVITL